MPRAAANGIELEYDTFGAPTDPALLLIQGFTSQMTAWDEDFCKLLAGRDRYVIRFDNRDCGLSTHLDGVQIDLAAVVNAIATKERPEGAAPYTLSDMAADAVGLLDALGIEQADVLGVSMGGMIAQTIAIEHPRRVRTLTSIMSTTGEPEYGQATPEALTTLLTPSAPDRASVIERNVETWRVISGKRYFDADRIRERSGAAYDRAFYPEGIMRQMAAIVSSPDRADGLRALRVPTLVIHGRDDTLITMSGGLRTAELVPGANLLLLHDMGHDLPQPLWPLLVDAIDSHLTHAIA